MGNYEVCVCYEKCEEGKTESSQVEVVVDGRSDRGYFGSVRILKELPD